MSRTMQKKFKGQVRSLQSVIFKSWPKKASCTATTINMQTEGPQATPCCPAAHPVGGEGGAVTFIATTASLALAWPGC